MTEDDSNSPTYELDDAYKRNLLEQKREAEPLPSKVMVLADKSRPGLFVGSVLSG